MTDPGAFLLLEDDWVEVDLWESVDGSPLMVFEALEASGGTSWERVYLRDIPTVLTITSQDLPDLVVGIDPLDGVISGTALDVLGRYVDGDVLVELVREGVVVDTDTVAISGLGVWSYTLPGTVPSQTGLYRYRFTLVPVGPPNLPSQVESDSFQVNSSSVVLSITNQPSGSYLSGTGAMTIQGTAMRSDGNPAQGTVEALLGTDDPDTTSVVGPATVAADGSWEVDIGNWGFLGQRPLSYRYTPLPGGIEEPTTKSGNTITVVLPTPSFSKGGIGNSSIAMSCSAVNGASGYQFYRGPTRLTTTTSRSFTNSGLSQGTQYNDYKVRAYGTTPAGATVYSSFSSQHDARTSRPESRDKGESGTITIQPSATGSWRTSSSNRWGERGDKVLQGAYSGFQQYGYFRGLIDFGSNGAYNTVKSALGGGSTGDNRINNGSCFFAEVYLWKQPSVGTSGSVRIRFHDSNSSAGGSVSARSSSRYYEVWSTGGGSGGWLASGANLAYELVRNKARSLAIIFDSTASDRYAEFNGRSSGSSDCRLRVKWRWDYVTVTAISGAWLN